MTERTFEATDDTLNDAIGFIEEELEKVDCPMKAVMQITVCVEEMYVNVAHYAYGENKGDVKMIFDYSDGCASITFIDSGMPFNPLEMETPDITLSAEDRKIGGLGIFMVRKSMDEVSYSYEDGKNIFTMKKAF